MWSVLERAMSATAFPECCDRSLMTVAMAYADWKAVSSTSYFTHIFSFNPHNRTLRCNVQIIQILEARHFQNFSDFRKAIQSIYYYLVKQCNAYIII